MSISSCAVPIFYTGNEIDKSRICGERLNKDGTVMSHIEYREIRHDIYWLFSIDGPGLHPIHDCSYYLISGNNTYKLSHIENSRIGYFLDQFYPIYSSDRWIAFQLMRVERNDVDIRMVIFNGDEIFHEELIKDCMRVDVLAEFFYKTESYNISLSNGNQRVRFKTKAGNVVYKIEDTKLRKS